MALQIICAGMAKTKLRRLTRPHNAYTGMETRQGDRVSFFRPAPDRSASRWCGPAESADAARDVAALLSQGGIRKVPQN